MTLPQAHRLGSLIGHALYLLPNTLRRTTAINLALCFPELTPQQRRDLLRRNLIEMGKSAAEAGPLWLWPGHKVIDAVVLGTGMAEFMRHLAEKRGAIIAAPHLGSWEVVGLYLSALHPMTSLYRPPHQRALEPTIRHGRERLGARLVPTTTQGVRALSRALHHQELVGILPDQDPGKDNGLFAPFFGQAANTITLLSKLAIKTGTPVFFVYAERLAHGRGYRLHCLKGDQRLQHAPLAQSVTLLNEQVEHCVRALPEQYQWGYKRFKTRPEGGARLYP